MVKVLGSATIPRELSTGSDSRAWDSAASHYTKNLEIVMKYVPQLDDGVQGMPYTALDDNPTEGSSMRRSLKGMPRCATSSCLLTCHISLRQS